MIVICIGTDMYPAISLAYEKPESDIMNRMPRHPKRDSMVSKKLMSFTYGQLGWMQALAGMIAYFIVMNDYGFKPGTLFFLNLTEGYYPKDDDVYNPNEPNFGNSNYGNADYSDTMDWGLKYQTSMDARLFYTSLTVDSFSKCRWDPHD
jgi:hypothetical protein